MSKHAQLKIYEHQKPLVARLLKLPLDQRLLQPVETLPFNHRTLAYCYKNDIDNLGQLAACRRTDLLEYPNLGAKSVVHIEFMLNQVELGLDSRKRNMQDVPKDWIDGANAMRRLIVARLTLSGIDPELRESLWKMPVPRPKEKLSCDSM